MDYYADKENGACDPPSAEPTWSVDFGLVLAAALVTGMWMGCGDAATEDGPVDLDAGADTTSTERLPCDVETVLVQRCQECHTAPPANDAPFPLLTYADTRADYFGDPIYERMRTAIETDFMPLDPREKLPPDERATVLDWIADGAPPAAPGEACP